VQFKNVFCRINKQTFFFLFKYKKHLFYTINNKLTHFNLNLINFLISSIKKKKLIKNKIKLKF